MSKQSFITQVETLMVQDLGMALSELMTFLQDKDTDLYHTALINMASLNDTLKHQVMGDLDNETIRVRKAKVSQSIVYLLKQISEMPENEIVTPTEIENNISLEGTINQNLSETKIQDQITIPIGSQEVIIPVDQIAMLQKIVSDLRLRFAGTKDRTVQSGLKQQITHMEKQIRFLENRMRKK